MFIKGVWVGRSETSDEDIVLTPGGRVFSRTSRRLEPSRRHDAAYLGKVKGLPWDALDGAVRGLPDKTEDKRSETPKETDDTTDADDVPMSETPVNDDRNASHIKSKSSDGVRQRLKFDAEA